MPGELILIDAFSQIFRSFFAIRVLTNSKGEPTNAIYVFTRLLLKIQEDYPSEYGALLFDCGRVHFRMELNPQYKANRPPMPDALKAQIPVIREMASAFGWPLIEEPEYEADDLIGALAVHSDCPVRIITADKDLGQLVDDRVTILAPAPKNGFETRNAATITEKFGVTPALLVDYLALVGDSSDNIPGVPGIGPKGAAAILNEFGPAASWIDAPERLQGSKFEKKLSGMAELIRKNQKLISLRQDLPERLNDRKHLKRNTPDWATIARLCRELELKSILKDLPAAPETALEEDLFATSQVATAPISTEPASSEMEQGTLF